jgi:hypothetical protein
MFFVVVTAVDVSQKHFSEAEPTFYASENGFSITEKTAGGLRNRPTNHLKEVCYILSRPCCRRQSAEQLAAMDCAHFGCSVLLLFTKNI